MIRTLALLLLLAPQGTDPAELIRQLGAADAAARDRASADLEKLGKAAIPALQNARASTDLEIRDRAIAVLERIEQTIPLEPFLRKQRAPCMVVPDSVPADFSGEIVKIEGLWFAFSRKPWAPDGNVLGTIFTTRMHAGPLFGCSWSIRSIRSDKDLATETCGVHSPGKVYVPGPVDGAAVVTIKGIRRWQCVVPIELKNPTQGMTRRAGPYQVRVDWPALTILSKAPVAEYLMKTMLDSDDIDFTIKPGSQKKEVERRELETFGVGVGDGAKPNAVAWCGCSGKPSTGKPAPQVREVRVFPRASEGYDLGDVESISFNLKFPVEEPFEVTSPPLK